MAGENTDVFGGLAFVGFVHEFEQLIDDRLEELPVGLEKARILSNNVHNVAGHNRLVVLSSLHLSQSEQVLNDGDKESLLGLFVHGQRDGANGPAENVAVVP
jgi:hypothetical protein